jgi:hypothetical protein
MMIANRILTSSVFIRKKVKLCLALEERWRNKKMKIINCILIVLSLLCTGFPALWGCTPVRSCIISKYSYFKNVLLMYSHYKTPDIWQLGKNDFERFGHVSKMLNTLPEQKTSEYNY